MKRITQLLLVLVVSGMTTVFAIQKVIAQEVPDKTPPSVTSQLANLQAAVARLQTAVNGLATTTNNLFVQQQLALSRLNHIQPTWDQTLPAEERFWFVMGHTAVLDRETGVVWELFPDLSIKGGLQAKHHCYNRASGGRKGWRLPTEAELGSLIDPTRRYPALPPGHPFGQIISGVDVPWFWAGELSVGWQWAMNLSEGVIQPLDSPQAYAWCVRGGQVIGIDTGAR